jgi:uncharacterized protein YgiM (DUF1202 family)
MSKIFQAGLAALLLSLYCSIALSETRLAYVVQDTELRAEPSHSAPSLGRMGKDTSVMVQARQGGWYQVQTGQSQSGWMPLLSLRFAKDSQARSGSNLGGLLTLGTQSKPASGVATGIRGISDEELQRGAGGLSGSLQYLESIAAQPAEARAFAQQGGLQSQPVPYAR